MTKQIITTNKAPKAIGPYSVGVKAAGLIFTAGQIPVNPETGVIPEGIEAQTRQSLENVKAVLTAGGASLNSVVKTTVFLKNMDDFGKMNAVYAEFFTENCPARSAVEVARLPKDALVEIEAVASVD